MSLHSRPPVYHPRLERQRPPVLQRFLEFRRLLASHQSSSGIDGVEILVGRSVLSHRFKVMLFRVNGLPLRGGSDLSSSFQGTLSL